MHVHTYIHTYTETQDTDNQPAGGTETQGPGCPSTKLHLQILRHHFTADRMVIICLLLKGFTGCRSSSNSRALHQLPIQGPREFHSPLSAHELDGGWNNPRHSRSQTQRAPAEADFWVDGGGEGVDTVLYTHIIYIYLYINVPHLSYTL